MSAVQSAVASVTGDSRVATAMLLGALLEGGSWDGPWAPGDQGTSFGPWQIHLPAHPGMTQADAENPVAAALFMLPEYTRAVSNVPAALWQSSPMQAAAQAVYLAERPAQMYPTARVAAAWAAMQGVTALPGGTTDGQPLPGGQTLGNPISDAVIAGIKSQLLGPLTPQNMARFGVATLGVVAVGVGAYVILS